MVAPGVDADERGRLLALAASAERASEHPLGRAIVEVAEAEGMEVPLPDDFRAVPGKGVIATIGGAEVAVGSYRLMRSAGDERPEESHQAEQPDRAAPSEELPGWARQAVDTMQSRGQTAVVQWVDGSVAAVYGIADRIRPDSPQAIAELGRIGVAVYMITGDNAATANAIAAQVGIPPEHVLAEVLPDGKAEEVKTLQRAGMVVAMTGDGKRRPALATADVGGHGHGTDIAMEAADITIVGGLTRLPRAIRLSRRTLQVIKQNLFWAFIYNTVGIPLAAFGIMPPVYAGAAMALSSVSVVTNSLRLRRFERS